MIIREASIADLNQLAKLFDAYRQFYRKNSDVEAARIFLTERMNKNESVIYVADADGALTGFVQLYPLFSSTRMKRLWLLNDLFVHPDFRRRGIAKQLFEKCFQLMRETNACGVMLETENKNFIGNKLYQQLGFELIENNFYFFTNQSS
ncbi:MAG: GNAT family N-acetyltransferase [Chitinophagales bacterium]